MFHPSVCPAAVFPVGEDPVKETKAVKIYASDQPLCNHKKKVTY